MSVRSQLVDARNFDDLAPKIIEKISVSPFTGLDIETHDDNAHKGIKIYRGAKTVKIFDARRTIVTGYSVYSDADDTAYYINLNHADVENRIPWSEARVILDARKPDGHWICHNAPFELTMMFNSLGYELQNVICTLQMAVSAYDQDQYDFNKFLNAGLGEMTTLLTKVSRAFRSFTPGKNMTPAQAEVFNQIAGKTTDSSYSYNGFVNQISYGHGLKKLVESFFGVKMTTFKQCLGEKAHMGELTGEEVVAYGADDAYWAVRVFHRLLQFMIATNPHVVKTFFEQENPMIHVYSDIWKSGLKVDPKAIDRRRDEERDNCAEVLRELKKAIKQLLPFPELPHSKLENSDSWYEKNYAKYRRNIETWADSPDSRDTYEQVSQVTGAVTNAWREYKGERRSLGPNFTHYMVMRTVMYDLLQETPIYSKGKTQSDGESRGRLMARLKKHNGSEAALKVLSCLNELAGIEQRMKLYLTPYALITDPETGRMYPVVSSQLVTHRMASSNPNGMQLAKRGESTYVRGFYKPDEDDEVMVSIDWSQIELVEIGDFSGDPEFAKCYGQIPYDDLHLGAACDGLKVIIPNITEDIFKNLHKMSVEEVKDTDPRLLLNVNGEEMEPGKAKKYWRTEIGKGSNFNYWYSGALWTVGEKLNWNADQVWEATDRYRSRFKVAEEWRQNTILYGRMNGYTDLPDGHRRTRFEATPEWAAHMCGRFQAYGDVGIDLFANEMIRKTQTRAANQLVNAKIQGGCATLAKRSILRINNEIRQGGYGAKFKLPIHDELLFSVKWREVVAFIKMAKAIMCDHPDIIKTLPIDATASVGLTFEPWDRKRVQFGQIELDEAPALECLPPETEGKRLNEDQIESVIDWLYSRRAAA